MNKFREARVCRVSVARACEQEMTRDKVAVLQKMFVLMAISLLILLGLTAPAHAVVERVGSWSSALSSNLSYTPGAGTDRVVLVAVTTEVTNQAASVSSVTYGGQLVTPIGSAVRGAGYSNIAWLGYCNETCIANASGSSIVVNSNVNNGYMLAAGTYQNVEQTNAVAAFDTNNSGSATITGSLNNAANNKSVYVASFNQASGTSTPSSGFSNQVNVGVGGNSHTGIVDERTATTAATPLAISTTFGASSSRTALVAVSLQEVQCAATAPSDLVANAPHGGRVDMTWTYDGINNDYYNIYRDGSLIGTSIVGAYTDYTVAVSTNYDYTVRGYNNGVGCESAISNTENLTTGNCAPSTGPIEINGGQTLSGSIVDLTSIVTDNAATVSSYTVSSQLAADFSEIESFSGGDPKGWTSWTSNNASNPPANRDLWTGISSRTEGTGPGTSPTGSFVYFDASTGTDTIRYLTHTGPFNADNNEMRVEFNYNMNGADIKATGALILQVQQDGGGWLDVWSAGGNLGDVWRTQTVDLDGLGYISGSIEVRFKFNYGTGFLGDIALDEVRVYGPGRAGTTYLNAANAVAAAVADTTSPAWPDASLLRLDIAGTDNCSTPLTDIGTFTFYVDNSAPVVSAFILPVTSVSPISVYAFNVNDDVAVTGYMITEDNTAPAVDDAGWQATKPTLITTASTGAITFYAWGKDAAGNVSTSLNATVTVSADVDAPIVTAFVMADSDFSPVPVVSFSATDNSGVVTGFMINESATVPGSGDAGWLTLPPATVTSGTNGATTFYAWTKDTAGNVSTAATYNSTVKVDGSAPVVTFVLPATASSLTFNVNSFSAADTTGGASNNTGVTGFMLTEVGIDADPTGANDSRWLAAPEFTIVASTDGTRTFKAWAKDAADNLSSFVSQAIDITLPASCDFDIDAAGTYIEAENYTNIGAASPWNWIEVVSPLNDASGDPSSGGYLSTTVGGTGAAPNGARADYPVNFPSGHGGTYCIWIRALDGAGNGGGDSSFWGIDGSVVGAITQTADNQWAWDSDRQNGANCTTISEGAHTLNLWPRENGQKTDAFFIGRLDANADPSAGGIFSGDNDQTTTTADLDGHPVKTIDPTCIDSSGGGAPGGGGGGSGWIYIPEGQSINGNPIDASQLFDTDQALATCSYRALGLESDGFNGFALDSKWSKTDIGGDPAAAPLLVSQQLRLYGGGGDIWGNSDVFTYLYQGGKAGSFTIDVKVDSIQNTNNWAKGGIMVRQSLAANSPNAAILITPGNGITFQRRVLSGGTSTSTVAAGQSVPKWLRLKRSGNSFFAYYSTNGSDWVLVGSDTVNMSGTVNVGLALTSHVNGTDTNALFDNFMYLPAGISGMNETWTATSGGSESIDTTGWSDGNYGLAISCTGVTDPETSTFYYNSCTDATPSTISVSSGQTIGGSSASLNTIYSHTGNVGTFSYQINGLTVLNPWNSYALVSDGNASTATFKVTGVDPDCGGSSITDTGVINVDNSCSDPDPSSLTILTGQSTGGAAVDLTQLFVSSTGDVVSNGLTYKVDGNVVGDPTAWDSRAYGTTTPESVIFEVSGVDPDCGNSVAAINTIEIDNACVFNAPSISFNQDINYVGAGRAVPYTITVRNEDSFNCGASTLTITKDSDDNSVDFDASFFNDPSTITSAGVTVAGDKQSATVTLAGRQSAVIEMAVTAQSAATEWNTNDTQVSATSVSGSNIDTATTKVFLVSPISHNSVTTNSAKWGGSVDGDGNTVTQGNWGTSDTVTNGGSKYGNFDCLTCHEKGGPNVKWMRNLINMPADSADATWGTSGLTSLPVIMQDLTENSDDWGDDDPGGTDLHAADTKVGVGRTGTTRACEVCHSATIYHRYDTEADPDAGGPLVAQTALNHFTGRDCTDCHRHSLGFTASCTGCHGNPPTDSTIGGPTGLADIPAVTGSSTPGTHYKHVKVLNYPCEYCHDGWRVVGEMPKEVAGQQDINHNFDVFARVGGDIDYIPATNGNYTGQDGVSYEGVITPAGQGTLTCETIYCHGGTDTMGGTNPQWNGNITCNSCHGTSASNTPPGYSHTTHVGQMGQACTVCHGDGTTNPLPGANGHVNGSVGWDLTGAPSDDSGTPAKYKGVVFGETGKFAPSDLYNGGYGTCTNVACHYGTETPAWNSAPSTCTTCHNNGTDNGSLVNSAPNTGNHNEHVDPAPGISTTMINTFINKCESCHGGSSNTGAHPGHIGASGGVSPVDPSDFVDFGGMTYDVATQTCTSLCHEASTPGDWGSTSKLTCEACHMAPYLGPTVVDPDSEGNGLYSSNGFGSHLKVTKGESITTNTNWDTQCKKCHPYHEGGVEVPEPPTNWDNPGTTGVTETDNMAYKLGLQFPVTGGIHLGGASTSGTTEADICWNCHGTDSEVNEWGYNADSNGANYPYQNIAPQTTSYTGHTYWAGDGTKSFNYGYLYENSNWTTATSKWVNSSGTGYYRRDAYQHSTGTNPDYLLSRQITSVHSVNFTAGSQVSSVATAVDGSGNVTAANQEGSADIRCSYCHDVHDLNKAFADVNTGVNEAQTGRPYLRGSWMGNPYAPDLPPITTYSYPTTGGPGQPSTTYGQRFRSAGGSFGTAKPRLFSHKDIQNKGGFFIDQNSNWPTQDPDYDSLEETAGICTLCHGSDINNMDYYPNAASFTGKATYTNTTMWRSGQPNGHANATLGAEGATHTNARNIFDGRRGGTSLFMSGQDGINFTNWGNNAAGSPKSNAPWRNNLGDSNQGTYYAHKNTGWYGGTIGDVTNQGTEYGIWYSGNTSMTDAASIGTNASGGGRAHDFTCSKCHSPHATGLPALLVTNCLDYKSATWQANANSGVVGATASTSWALRAQTTCHRKDGATSGWNRLNIRQ